MEKAPVTYMRKIAIFFVFAFILILIFLRPYSKYRELKIKNKVLTDEIEYLKEVNKTLEAEKKALEEDPAFVEKRAREKMGIVKEGEIIYKIVPPEE